MRKFFDMFLFFFKLIEKLIFHALENIYIGLAYDKRHEKIKSLISSITEIFRVYDTS